MIRETCIHCDGPLETFGEAVRHHAAEHSRDRFDPLWYTEPDEWDEVVGPPSPFPVGGDVGGE